MLLSFQAEPRTHYNLRDKLGAPLMTGDVLTNGLDWVLLVPGHSPVPDTALVAQSGSSSVQNNLRDK
ncbi:hypothetical protein J6590_016310 [Homalodisca vitripennis]|nr:hypothetical protein J6590_016310 [Homalodisca vitripennis]